MHDHLKTISLSLLTLLTSLLLAACGKIETGQGASPVTGSAGPDGGKGTTRELITCDAPIATIAVIENPRGYVYAGAYGLPQTPVPLVRLMLQQSGCFRVVDREAGLKGTLQEQELAKSGVLRKDQTIQQRQVIEAQLLLTPNLVFSENQAGGAAAGIMSQIPGLKDYAGIASAVKFKEAQVTLILTDTETTEQLGASEGSAKAADLGAGGLVLGKLGGGGAAGGLGWNNTNEGKIIAAAFLDATNKLVPHVKKLKEKQLPAPVKMKG